MRSPKRELPHHHVHLVPDVEQLAQAADHLLKAGRLDAVDRSVELERFLRGQIPPERIFLSHDEAELPFHFVAALPRHETEDAGLARARIQQSRKHLKHGCLARAVRSEKSDELAFFDLKGDVVRRAGLVVFSPERVL